MELRKVLGDFFDSIENVENVKCNVESYIKENPREAIKFLREQVNYELEYIAQNKEIKEYKKLNAILYFLSIAKVDEVFEVFWDILQNPAIDQNCEIIAICFANIISDDNQISLLKERMKQFPQKSAGKRAVFIAIERFYIINERREELKKYYNEMIPELVDNSESEMFCNLPILFRIINNTLQFKFIELYIKLSDLLIQLIIYSKEGYNASWFENYFILLCQLTPSRYAKIIEIENNISQIPLLNTAQIFEYKDFKGLGKYYFDKIAMEVDCSSKDLVKVAIKQLKNKPPHNQRKQPISDEEYYEEICAYLEMTDLPINYYQQAEKEYTKIFENGFIPLQKHITKLITEIQDEVVKKEAERERITTKSNSLKATILHDIEDGKNELLFCNFIIEELQTLYCTKNNGPTGVLKYYKEQLENIIKRFCENTDIVCNKLREIALKCSYRKIDSIETYFQPYQNRLEYFSRLLEGDKETVLWKTIYFIKFFPFYNGIINKYKNTQLENDTISRIRDDVENHPLFPDKLINSSLQDLSIALEAYLPDTISSIYEILHNSVCLKKRKTILDNCLKLINKKETNSDELVLNLLPIQIEGLFSDLLEHTTISESFSDINGYYKFLKAELVKKIEMAIDRKVSMYNSCVAYFKYYFNSIIRNTIAHGNYELLIQREMRKKDTREENSNNLVKRILALELIYDLNFLVQMIYDINEIDTANRYINYTFEQYSSLGDEDKQIFYECTYLEFSGKRDRLNFSHYKPGIFVTFDPKQILLWIFNPYYEKFLDYTKLKKIREIICSTDFWIYIKKEKLEIELQKNGRVSNQSLKAIVSCMFNIAKRYNKDELKECLIDVKKMLE